MSRTLSETRSPIPVSTRTRPAGVSTKRQFSAWRSRWSASISVVTRRSQRILGTGPNRAPASLRKVPAWTSATRVPPPRSVAQSTASLIATSVARRALLGHGALRGSAAVRATEVAMEGRRGGFGLALVLGPELRTAVRPLHRAGHLEEGDLTDLHAEIERDRQVRHVGQLERQVALPAGIDVAGRRVDQEPEPAKRAVVGGNKGS